jgi:hypothetical protein
MSAQVIDLQSYREGQSPEENSEYKLLQEVMRALFGPLEEPKFEEEIKELDSVDASRP